MTTHKESYTIPYRSKLQDKFEPGQSLIIKGSSTPSAQRFSISLLAGGPTVEGNDVPLHISVRFDEKKLILNTQKAGAWGKEDKKSNPLKKGEKFDIRIRALDDKFKIFVDKKEYEDYEHKLPLSSITHFAIEGDIQIDEVHWGGKFYPVPFEGGIPGGINPGKKVLLYGVVEKKATRFEVNVVKGNGDVALHFNPRFSEKHVIRNALLEGKWGNEEREGKMPFEKGHAFDLLIVNEPFGFQVFVNDARFCSFAHRTDPHDMAGLRVSGDVELTGIVVD